MEEENKVIRILLDLEFQEIETIDLIPNPYIKGYISHNRIFNKFIRITDNLITILLINISTSRLKIKCISNYYDKYVVSEQILPLSIVENTNLIKNIITKIETDLRHYKK